MKFDISSNIKSIYECVSKLEDTPVNKSLKLLESVTAIDNKVFKALKESAADPHNLKIVTNRIDDKLNVYIEAIEFITYCEAGGFITIKEAVDHIKETYADDNAELGDAVFNVVIPDKNFAKDIIGGENLGVDTKEDWPMQLISGCSRYGINVKSAIE